MRKSLVAIAVLVATALTACSGGDETGGVAAAPSSGGKTKVTYVTTAAVPGSTQIALFAVPTAMKYFEEEGLDVTLQTTNGSTAALQVIAAGDALATNAEVVSTMAAVQKGVDVRTVGSINTSFPWKIGVPEGSKISTAADLKGKKIGIISLASGSNLFTRSFLQQNGLNPDTDVQLLPVGQGAQAKAALDSHQVDALALYAELFAQLEMSGSSFTYLQNPPLFDGMPSIAFTARADDLTDARKDVLTRYMRAAYKGLMFAAVNPEAAVEMGTKVFPQIAGPNASPQKKKELVTLMKAWLSTSSPQSGDPSTWPDWGVLTEEGLNKAAEYAVSTGQVAKKPVPSEVWNGSLVTEVNKFDKAALIKQARDYTTG
ncbi:ABC transporter substrate-binding protein [Microbispora cellulosiformans]|uniref:ABC transporter substrate-binding protein n=1 Tax=Microbispora cellulosiformans TaxID=2614688 RepID=A0A5J5KCG0_9ACTN|nr:ABC transporter substrate-binding protein [Microbispora cellulosiformans]KAA9381544.1 ABC transporter substrate-binding protein [Microbispora cellulosiformans]